MDNLTKEQALEALHTYERKLGKLPADQAHLLMESMRERVQREFDPEIESKRRTKLQLENGVPTKNLPPKADENAA